MNLPDGTPVVGWSWPPAPVADEPAPPRCKCSHAQAHHITDRRGRNVCRSAACGCAAYRPKETEQ